MKIERKHSDYEHDHLALPMCQKIVDSGAAASSYHPDTHLTQLQVTTALRTAVYPSVTHIFNLFNRIRTIMKRFKAAGNPQKVFEKRHLFWTWNFQFGHWDNSNIFRFYFWDPSRYMDCLYRFWS